MRLFPKLLLAFVIVVLLGVFVVAALANASARREVGSYMVAGRMAPEDALVTELAGYYRGHGAWDGVDRVLGPGHGMAGMMGQRFVLTDGDGLVVFDSWRELDGRRLDRASLADGSAVTVDGVPVGTLIARGGMPGAPVLPIMESGVLSRVNRAIWLAALAATLVAVVVGGVLAYGLVRPIRTLTLATGAVARGQLSQRVSVHSGDEIGELATAFNSMAASLENGERLRREMTADIAHELRNPIAVLQGNLEALLDGVLPPTPDNLQPLLVQTHLLARLVDDLRTLALAEAGQLSLERLPTDPAELIQGVLTQFQPSAEAKGIALSAEVAPGLRPISVDPQRLAQVLGNLLSNALRHTPEGGRVVCRVTQDAAQARVNFSVADSGPGIAPEALPHVFERFYRADRARSRADGGTGLGLTIARQLVEAHGGAMWVKSEAGQGAEVGFGLPVLDTSR
jgi:signal transduction histidine kinase